MPRSTITISIFLASPSDVEAEREVVARTIEEWNQINGFDKSVAFELIRWETSISAGFGADGQDVINNQLPNYDVLVAIFWTRIGTPTERSISGSAEEYERALARRKGGDDVEIALYFKEGLVDPRVVDLAQIAAVQSFEKKAQSEGAFSKNFSSTDALRVEINLLLDRVARRYPTIDQTQITKEVPTNGSNTDRPLTSNEVEEDLGLYDILENLQKHGGEATGALSDITAQIGVMSAIVSEGSAQLGGIARIRAIEPQEARPVINRITTGMNNLSSFLENSSPIFSESSVSFASDIRSLIDVSYDFAPHHENPHGVLLPFRDVMVNMIIGLSESNLRFEDFIEVLNTLQRTTKEFNQARRRLIQNSSNLVNSTSQIKELIEQALKELDDLIQWIIRQSGAQ